ncbi:MAG: hypothetical protein AAFY74_17235 [Pseudomonadota bacterium]
MSILTQIPPSLPWYKRLFYSVPVIGWMARDVAFGSKDNIYYAIAGVLSCWVMAIMAWGLPALYLPMVCLVPFCFLTLVIITRG